MGGPEFSRHYEEQLQVFVTRYIIASRKHHTAFRVCTGQEKLEESIYLKNVFHSLENSALEEIYFKKNCSRITSSADLTVTVPMVSLSSYNVDKADLL